MTEPLNNGIFPSNKNRKFKNLHQKSSRICPFSLEIYKNDFIREIFPELFLDKQSACLRLFLALSLCQKTTLNHRRTNIEFFIEIGYLNLDDLTLTSLS